MVVVAFIQGSVPRQLAEGKDPSSLLEPCCSVPSYRFLPTVRRSWVFQAAFVIAAIVDATDAPGLNLSAYSFWAFTDIFTEQGFPSHAIPYHGALSVP